MIQDQKNFKSDFNGLQALLAGVPDIHHMQVHRMYNLTVGRNWGFRNRRNRDLHIALVRGGKGGYTLDDRTESIERGKVVFVSHQFSHTTHTDPEHQVSFIPIRFGIYRNDTHEQVDYGVKPFAFGYFPTNFLKHKQLYESLYQSYISNSMVSRRGYQSSILTQILMLALNDISRLHASLLEDARIQEIKDYIDANVHEHLTIEDLAARARLSSKYFIRFFEKFVGQSPKQYIIRRRIDRSLFLIQETEMSLQEIALELGYSDQFSFSKQFKAVMGCSPREFNARSSDMVW